MNTILVIGASGGIGSALCAEMQRQEYTVLPVSRAENGFDITDANSVDQHIGSLRDLSGVIIATGALEINGAMPEKSISRIDAKAMADQMALNAIGPALVLRHLPTILTRTAPTTVGVLSARVGSIGDNRLGGWISYRAAKAALNQIVHTTAIELARTHPKSTCVCLHPGTVQTKFTEKYLGRHPSVSPETAATNLLQVLSRLTPADTGKFFDYSGQEVPW